MSWIRFDDTFTDDPAILALGELEARAGWTYMRLCSYAARHLTDGEIPVGVIRREDQDAIAALVTVQLLELRATGAGYLPRFLDQVDDDGRTLVAGHHPPKAIVLQRREARAEAGRAGGLAKAKASANHDLEHEPQHLLSNGAGSAVPRPVSRLPVSRTSSRPPHSRASDIADDL